MLLDIALDIRPREVVLADEPTSALDSRTGREVVELLLRPAREQGCPILMVTHDARIADVADRIIRMEDGRIVSEGDLGTARARRRVVPDPAN